MNSRERALKAFKRLPGLPDSVTVQFAGTEILRMRTLIFLLTNK